MFKSMKEPIWTKAMTLLSSSIIYESNQNNAKKYIIFSHRMHIINFQKFQGRKHKSMFLNVKPTSHDITLQSFMNIIAKCGLGNPLSADKECWHIRCPNNDVTKYIDIIFNTYGVLARFKMPQWSLVQ
mgnify:CR=1 FL=1